MTGEPSWTDDVDAVADRERIRSAVESRRRERWRRDRQVGWTTTAAALSAAHGSPVTVHLVTGASLHGRVAAVGPDVVCLDTGERIHHVALAGVAATTVPGRPGDDPVEGGPTLLELLEELRDDGATHSVVLAGGATVLGQVVGAGPELVLRTPDGGSHVVVAIDSIVVVS